MSKTLTIDHSWTLFLDRDGTINKRIIGDYIRSWDQFEFLNGALEGLSDMNPLFGQIIIVTNQQGIGKELMTEAQLHDIHANMLDRIEANFGRADEIYHCPYLAETDPLCRKPNPGMALQAKKDFPEIDFKKSIMVGDSESDMLFGKNLGMQTFLVKDSYNQSVVSDFRIANLSELILYLKR